MRVVPDFLVCILETYWMAGIYFWLCSLVMTIFSSVVSTILLHIYLFFFSIFIFLSFFFSFAVLGFEFRTLLLLGSYSTIWATPTALFMLVIFELGSHFTSRPAWTAVLLLVLPHITGMTDMHHCNQPLVEMGSCECFAWSGLQLWSSWSLLSK
jgi:hypothetical protein